MIPHVRGGDAYGKEMKTLTIDAEDRSCTIQFQIELSFGYMSRQESFAPFL
jgi:hypothetical protein